MKSTFKVAFYLKRKAEKRAGTAPIVARITINGKVSQFNTKLYVKPSLWSVKQGKVKGQNKEAKEKNALLEEIKARIYKNYHELTISEETVTSETVKNEFLGLSDSYETLLTLFDKHNEDVKKLVGVSKSKATYQKYCVTRKHLANFIESHYRLSDIALNKINGSR